MTRVCILTSVHPPFDARIFHKQAKTLVKAGYDVTLIAQHDKDEVIDGIRIIALPRPRNRLWRMLGTWRVFRLALRQKADIYHIHDPELLPAGLLLKLVIRGKVIYDVHEDYGKQILSKQYLPKNTRRLIARFVNLIEKSAVKFFDTIIAVTDDIMKDFSYHKRAVLVRNFPILSAFSKMEKNTNSGNVFSVIYAGGISEVRGISEIVEAMSYLDSAKNVRLVLCGKFEPENYQDEIRILKGAEMVECLGWLESEEVWQKETDANAGIVCLHPTERYRLPVKLFEYMAAGLPVIASDFPVWKGIVEGNNCGLTVNPLDPKEIAGAIEFLFDHPSEAKKMGENGRKAVLEKYNWEVESRKLLELYSRLIGD